jgi:hypothetical protein
MQGYISLATGSRFYLDLALNLALSLKHNDPGRPFGLIVDEEMQIPQEYEKFIDEVVRMPPREGFHGCLNKLRVSSLSPFEETMFIDSDCLLVKADMDRHWARFDAPGFSAAGGVATKGSWYGFEIEEVLAVLQMPFMVQLNSGVFYFRRGEATDKFFDTALDLVAQRSDLLGTFHRNKLQLADEPFIGAAMGALRIQPVQYEPEEGSIMITTYKASQAEFDVLRQTSRIVKHDNFLLAGRFLPRTRLPHSPSLAHFVKLKPERVYSKAVNDLRHHYGLGSFQI